jgi:hypothetical protein
VGGLEKTTLAEMAVVRANALMLNTIDLLFQFWLRGKNRATILKPNNVLKNGSFRAFRVGNSVASPSLVRWAIKLSAKVRSSKARVLPDRAGAGIKEMKISSASKSNAII